MDMWETGFQPQQPLTGKKRPLPQLGLEWNYFGMGNLEHDDFFQVVDVLSDDDTDVDSLYTVAPAKKICTVNIKLENNHKSQPAFQGQMKKGSWLPSEEKILLHVVYVFACFELKYIAEAAWKCGINRPRRAIGKKIKRFLRFDKWRLRVVRDTRRSILAIVDKYDMKVLSDVEYETLESVRAEYAAQGMGTDAPLYTPN